MRLKLGAASVGLLMLAMAAPAAADGELNIYNWGNYTSPEMIRAAQQALQRENARQGDAERDDPGEDRPVDEEAGPHVRRPQRAVAGGGVPAPGLAAALVATMRTGLPGCIF